MLKNHQFQEKTRVSNSSNTSRLHGNSHLEDQVYTGLNQFPIKKIRHQKINLPQDTGTVTPINAKKQTNNDNPLTFYFGIKQNQQQTKTPLVRLDQNRNISIQNLIKKINNFSERIDRNQRQIQKLKVNQSQFVKKHQFIEVSSIIKDFKASTKRTQSINKEIQGMKFKIDMIKNQLSQNVLKKDFDIKIESVEGKIKEQSDYKKSSGLLEFQIQRIITTIKAQITQTINEFVENFKKSVKQQLGDGKIMNRSMIFASNWIKICHEERITAVQERKEGIRDENRKNIVQQKIYHIDYEGFLLDDDKCYLVDTSNKLIRLSDRQMDILKKFNILSLN